MRSGRSLREQVRGIEIATSQYPQARWVIALHHHLVEYPRAGHGLAERIGTALINGNGFVRRLRPLAGRAVVMHGHRHIDWIGECAGVRIVSAPSPVMGATDNRSTYFYIHSLAAGDDGRLEMLPPQRSRCERPKRRLTNAASNGRLTALLADAAGPLVVKNNGVRHFVMLHGKLCRS